MKQQVDISTIEIPLENNQNLHDRIEIRLPSDPKILKVLRLAVLHMCECAGFREDDGKSTMLAVDEACTNIIKHTYKGQNNRPIIAVCEIIGKGIQVTLRDFGKKVQQKKLKSRALDDIRPGGLGIHFISSIMDKVEYDNSCKEGNKLVMTKYDPQSEED